MTCACGCLCGVKDALIKTAGLKRIRDILTARILMEDALSTEFCPICEGDYEYCPHGECCVDEKADGDPDWEYCPWCGVQLD